MQKRFLLFLIGCMGVRFFLVYLAKTQLRILKYLGYIAILPAIGFLSIFFGNLRTTGAEVFGGKIWWNPLRPIHGILWAIFAYFAIKEDPRAWIILLIDTLLGLFAFLGYHLIAGDFKLLYS